MAKSIIKDKSFEFAVRIVKMFRYLREQKSEYILSKQVLRSGTSIGANVREALNGQSTPDFISKLSIAQKEANETLYWIELLHATDYLDKALFDSIHPDGEEVYKIITSILISTKNKNTGKKQ